MPLFLSDYTDTLEQVAVWFDTLLVKGP